MYAIILFMFGGMIMEFSYLVKKARQHLNISQEQLARELSVSFSTVNRWENGKAKPNNLAKNAFRDFCKKNNLDIENGEI